MPTDRKSHHFFSRTKPQQAPETPDDRPQAPTPNIQVTVSATENDRPIRVDYNQSAGSHPGTLSASGTSKDDAAQQRTRLRDRISDLFRRSPSPDSNRRTQSSTLLGNNFLTSSVQASPGDPPPFLSPLPAKVNTGGIPTALVGDDDASVPTQHEFVDLRPSVLAVSSVPAEPASRRSDGAWKDIIVSGTKVSLQTAATALKLVPIPNLDQLPNTLLSWIRIYENVSGNTEELSQLCVVIQQAQESVFEPLRQWTGEIPRELESLVQKFREALKTQLEDIESVQNKHIVERTIRAPDITQQITNMKTYLNDVVHRFELRTSTLILLRTERLSVHSELSRLKRAPAEHTCVTSKSECLPETRVNMQESLLKHLKEAKNRFVWLRGSPGMGKTAISMSIASTLEKEGTLAASYFWDKNRAGTGLDSIEQFPFTLAHQLACFNEDFKFSLVRHLRKPALASVQNFPLKKQMKTLMIEPMRDLKDIFPSGKDRFIIVLDGLDECGNQETLESLMELVLTLQELPTGFSVLVSCRPERGVISAWSEAQADGLVIPCEDVDKIQWETFHTIRQMVKEGLRGFVKESSWKPTESELNGFALACRGLPVVASIRVRDVHVQTRRGRTLQSAFQNLLTLTHVPTDLDQEYLRILRQAYVLGSSGIPSDVAKTYRLVVGTIVVAREPMNVSFISQLFEVDENEIYAILEPISSIVDLREETLGVTFYDASAKEFLMGEPVGNEEDKVFFIDDVKGYFLGLPLLRLFNGNCEQNVFGVPADLPLGNERKWGEFMAKKYHFQYRWRFHYVVRYLLEHLDPSQLFSRESNELQNEFDSFITRNYLLTWLHLQNEKLIGDNASLFPEELLQFNNHSSVQLLRELHWLAWIAASEPWSLYRSELPFTPLSSPLHKQYGHLSDPVRILSFFGKFSGGTIPLSEDSLRAQEVMMAKLGEPREQSDGLDEETSEPDEDTNGSEEAINHDAEFQEPDVRNGIVTCAALSLDGRYVALGFGSGIIEVADIDHQQTICRLQHDSANLPVWIEFVHGSHRIASEDINGNVTILGGGMAPAKPGTLPPGSYPPGTAVSDNGLFIARAPRTLDNPWCDNMTLISVSGIPTLKHLAPPPFSLSSSSNDEKLVIPHRRTLGFSPGARYICTFDGIHAVTWSTDSCQCISGYRVTNFERWIINPTVPPSHPHSIPDPIFTRTTLPLPESDTAYAHCSEVEAEDDSGDESWIKRPFYDFSPSRLRWNELRYSSVATRIPLLGSHISGRCSVWLNGREELELPWDYQPIDSQQAWYGHRVPHDSLGLYRPQSSRDGTRFLVQGWRRAPIVIDIS